MGSAARINLQEGHTKRERKKNHFHMAIEPTTTTKKKHVKMVEIVK